MLAFTYADDSDEVFYSYNAPAAAASSRADSREFVPILRDDRVHEDGHYSFDVETGNGISRSEAGQPQGSEEAVIKAGSYS